MPSTSIADLHELQTRRFSGEPLLPILLSDPNLQCAADDQKSTVGPRSPSSSGRVKSHNPAVSKVDDCRAASKPQFCQLAPEASTSRRFTDKKDASTLRRLLRRHWCPQAVSCDKLLTEYEQSFGLLPTGIATLDSLLEGGFRTGEIAELVGKSAVGKTQIALRTCAALLAASSTATVLYVDTKGDFSSHRLYQLLQSLAPSPADAETDADSSALNPRIYSPLADCLRRIRHVTAHDPSQLADVLIRTRLGLASRATAGNPVGGGGGGGQPTSQSASLSAFVANLRLLVVDSLAMPYLPFMGSVPQIAKSHLALVTSELQRISSARPYGSVGVLVTNHARGERVPSNSGEEVPPICLAGCLGRSWSRVPHRRVFLQRQHQLVKQLTVHALTIEDVCQTAGSPQWSPPFVV